VHAPSSKAGLELFARGSPRPIGTAIAAAVLAVSLGGCITINVGQAAPSPTSPSETERCAATAGLIRQEQQSMEPALEPGDQVLVDPVLNPSRGDIVAFNPPASWVQTGVPYLKRVIGIGGDGVEIRDDGFVYLNGTKLDEPYVYADNGVRQPTTPMGQSRWLVSSGELFVLGDHRDRSADSRAFGTVPVSSVIGRVAYRCTPNPGAVH
jgi:signal peptidase I